MTYSLNTFNASEAATARHGLIRFASEIGLFLGFVLLALWIMALLTYTPRCRLVHFGLGGGGA